MAARAAGTGRYLVDYRLRIVLVIAFVEALLFLLGVLPGWALFVLFGISVVFWATAGRTYQSETVREASWILATSQTLAALVPLLDTFVKTVVYVLLAVVAILALVFLFTERDRSSP